MPTFTPMANRRWPIAKKILLITYHLSLITVLTGCTVIGTSKFAALQVTSIPEASIFLDGKHIGKTPFFSDQLKSAEHTLKITISEANYVDKITLTAGTLTVVNRELANNFLAQSGETLWLEPGKKGVFLASIPDQADLTIDGKLVGKTPILIAESDDSEHRVLLSKTGYIQREFSIKTSSKYRVVANVFLASEIAKGIDHQASASAQPKVEKVEITRPPQGFLRVRKEPELTASEVGRVETGDQLEVLQETKDWIKIKFEGKQGWISSQYTKKL